MEEFATLKQFLNFPLSSSKEIFALFKTLDGHIFREKDSAGKQRFLYFEGARTDKVVLIAHAVTVYDYCYRKSDFFHSIVEENGILKAVDENGSPQLSGADNRAGVAMLWLLKDSGHSLLLVDGEEASRTGSKWLMKENKDIAERLNKNHRFMIQLDRCNASEYKCYNVGSAPFRAYIEAQTGFSEPDYGSLTDICSLCKSICGVNLSIGYYYQHSVYEYLKVDEWMRTLTLVRKILASDELPKFGLSERGAFERVRFWVGHFLGMN